MHQQKTRLRRPEPRSCLPDNFAGLRTGIQTDQDFHLLVFFFVSIFVGVLARIVRYCTTPMI
jgi:hypothetical protein